MTIWNPLERDMPLNHTCPNCGAKPRVQCGKECANPGDGGAYIIHCIPGDGHEGAA